VPFLIHSDILGNGEALEAVLEFLDENVAIQPEEDECLPRTGQLSAGFWCAIRPFREPTPAAYTYQAWYEQYT
jgi:hypothetical protein